MAQTRASTKSSASPPSTSRSHASNLRSIALIFLVWKAILLIVVSLSPGPGYDTSTDLLLNSHLGHNASYLSHLLTRLVRWDALYFVTVAERGYRYEQEWAWGYGYTFAVGRIANVLPESLQLSPTLLHALAGALLSHIAHLVSSLLLYALTLRLVPRDSKQTDTAFLAAALHVLSPAGVFLSAPYSEAPFACLNFAGFLLLSYAGRPGLRHTLCMGAGGACFALASTVRGNGLLSVLAFAVYGLPVLRRVLAGIVALEDVAALPGLMGGVLVTVAGFVGPQYLAYVEYCTGEVAEKRPWCTSIPPSVYTFVQGYYWNNGFLKYWTFPNIPLFVMALPVLRLLFTTATSAILPLKALLKSSNTLQPSHLALAAAAAPQLALTVLAFTSFHVQITNRISTGYPVWYIVLAAAIVGQSGDGKSSNPLLFGTTTLRSQERMVKGLIIYALIQAGLYACFLPPA